MSHALPAESLDQLFRTARTHNVLGGTVDDATIHALYDLLKWGPTSANMSPARFVFVRSPGQKARLSPAVSQGNREKTLAAPVTVIVGYDLAFYEKLPQLFPHADARAWFAHKTAEELLPVAAHNAALQEAYLILSARALGLDTGPMTGFDNAHVDALFFADTTIRSSLLVNLGHGDHAQLFPRSPRLSFDEAATIV